MLTVIGASGVAYQYPGYHYPIEHYSRVEYVDSYDGTFSSYLQTEDICS